MELTGKLLTELQRRLKIGNRRGVHLNAIPSNSRYKFDLNRLSYIDKSLPNNFIKALLSEQPLKFRISWKENISDLNSLFEEEQTQLIRITKSFENLINQTEAIESEKGINTFGFGFPILARRDKIDNKLTVAPILIWSLRIKRTKEFNTWEILRNEEDPIYINEVLINHLQNDSKIEIEQIPSEMLDDGLIHKDELIDICSKLIRTVNTTSPNDLEEIFRKKLDKVIPIGDKAHYEKLPLNSTNSFIEFGGLFSIFEVQKQNIINDYGNLMELKEINIPLDDLKEHYFQPISSVETDPSQQSILHSLEATRNILIQGPPGTGKSQTLTAVLINALENNKKTIVVCEKRTALEVLHNALIKKGLSYHCVLIRDIVKDRKTVVDSVRNRIDNIEYRSYKYNYSKENLENVIKKAKTLITKINNQHQKLDKKIIGSKSWTYIVGDLLAKLKNNADDINLNIDKKTFSYTEQEQEILLNLLQKGQSLYSEFSPIESTSFINSQKLVGDNPYIVEQKMNDDFDFYSKELKEIKRILEVSKDEYKILRDIEFKQQREFIQKIIEKLLKKELELDSILSKSKEKYFTFRRNEFTQQLEIFNQIANQIETIFINNQNNDDLLKENKINGLPYKFLSVFSSKKKQTVDDFLALQKSFSKLEKYLKDTKDIQNTNFKGSLVEKKAVLQKVKNRISEIKDYFDYKILAEFSEFNLDIILEIQNNPFQKIQKTIESANSPTKTILQSIKNDCNTYLSEITVLFQELAKELSKSKDISQHYSFQKPFSENKNILLEIQAKVEIIQNQFDTKVENEFKNINFLKVNFNEISINNLSILQEKSNYLISKLIVDNWLKNKITINGNFYLFLTELEKCIETRNKHFNSEKDLFTIEFKWFQFYNNLPENQKKIVDEMKTKSDWKRTFLVFYLNSLLVNSASNVWPINDDEYKNLDSILNGIEKEQLRFIKEFWFSKQIDATREFEKYNNSLTVENLYNKRSSSRFKRLSLRQIIQKDADLFSTFFPIILTSPDVASNLFKGMNGYFDIVMFDEASQLRIEDNLPAILKGKQIIIAGDEHQMPPSNYFSKVFDGSVEDEDDLDEEENDQIKLDKNDILLSCESLLEFGEALNFRKKHLDFHYRSRHPFLIDFSNYAFYKQRLKPLPNNFDYVPIKYIQVNGTFSDHTNEAEAEMVLSIIDKNINRLPSGEYPTVGIATFNIAQRNLIKSKILERQKFSKYEKFNAKIQELEKNGLFVKNLENIQGDERDVIILSTTYGRGKDRKFAQRFGPINHSKGYKLLNVIITRAKYKVYCCSSIPEQEFMNYKEYLTVEGSNNKRAVMYAYLAYCKAVSESDNDSRLSVLTALAENTSNSTGINPIDFGELESPFEEEVYQSLVDYFGTEKLIPQLQFAGFRIDIVYDPKITGVPKVAIECDGAKYHSSHEAYLYDRHRQKILENHGFVFHRIWSTNWWRDSNRETIRLIDFIKQVEATTNIKHKDHSLTASAFTDDIEILEKYVAQNSFIDVEKDGETIQAIEQAALIQTQIFADDVIRLNSKVQVKYLNDGKSINVQLVSSENNKPPTSGVQKIYHKAPLAVSLLGHTIGDIVKVGSLDNFVEIIQIEN